MNKSVFAKCIDVSRWQGSIDWKVVKASGIGNVMIRCSSWDNRGQVCAGAFGPLPATVAGGL